MKNAIIALAVLLAGCANTSNPVSVAQATKANYDPYAKQTTVLGELVKQRNYLGMSVVLYRLEANLGTDTEPAVRLDVGANSSRTNVLYAATDIDATTLSVAHVGHGADMNADENVSVGLTRAYLESHKASGLDIRLTGSGQPLIVKVPGPYVEGFLTKLDQAKVQTAKCGAALDQDAKSDAKPNFFWRLFHSKSGSDQAVQVDCRG